MGMYKKKILINSVTNLFHLCTCTEFPAGVKHLNVSVFIYVTIPKQPIL